MEPVEFIALVAPGARQAQADTGVPASLTIAQAILETGWGTTPLCVQAHNYFGQKAHLGDTDPYQTGTIDLPTWEDYGQGPVTVTATFCRYPDAAASIRSHARYLIGETGIAAYAERPLPATATEWARWIVTPPRCYATDPAYTSKLLSLMDRFSLRDYDKETPVDLLIGLAPSAQPANAYAAGLGTEKQHMDELAAKVLALLKPLERPGLRFDAYLDGQSYTDNVAASNARGWTHHVALHSNADADPSGGVPIPTMGFWYPGSVEGEKLARAVAGKVAPVAGLGAPTLYARGGLAELKRTAAKACLIEVREHDTPEGARDIIDRMDAYATAVAEGVLDYLRTLGFDLSLVPVASPLSSTSETIRKGSTGAAVLRWTTWLRATFPSYASRVSPGTYFGGDTDAATREFQRRVYLDADGIVGPKTYAAARKLGYKG